MLTFDQEQRKIALSLFVVALVSALLLGIINQLTKEPIAKAKREALHKSLAQVLPEHSNDSLKDMFLYPLSAQQQLQVFPAKNKSGKLIAYAWEQVAPDGYSGTIRILMAVTIKGEIAAVRVTEHRETPGLGDGISNDMTWLNSFVHHTLHSIKWAVKKDGGDFDQFTGATITPRAVVKAVHQGLTLYQHHKDSFLKTLAIKEAKQLQDKLSAEKAVTANKKDAGGKKP